MRRNKLKLGLGVLTVLATPIAVNTVASNDVQAAQGWVRSGNAWYLYNQNGTLVRNAWAGNYWLGADGRMATNAWVDGGRYYVGSNGAWVKGAQHQTTASETKQGWTKVGNAWYFYNHGKVVANAWIGNYWLGADGRMATNAWVDGGRYYVGTDGAWVKGAQHTTTVKSGWVKEGYTWYYYKNGLVVRNAWAGNYWLGADGRMATNRWVDNNRYYVGNDGAWVKDAKRQEEKKTGWVKESNVWYYYNTDGTLARNKWAGNYWLGADGKMATNSWVDNGRYYVGSNGAWIPNYSKGDNKTTAALNMPQYYQGDYRWRNKRFGIGTMAQSGCAPTSLAMVFSGLGQKVLPTSVAETIYNHTNEMNVRELGTSGKGVVYAINAYGYSYSVITSKEQLIAALQSGKPVFAAVGNGIFARGGLTHAIVLSGYSNGKRRTVFNFELIGI